MSARAPAPLTPAQANALQLAVDSGGELIVGGPDGQPVSVAVANRLLERGYLSYEPKPLRHGDWYELTAAGRARAAQL